MLAYRYKACRPGIKEQVVEMALNGSGIRDTARVLKINKNTVISTLQKSSSLVQVNPNFQALNSAANLAARLELACDEHGIGLCV
jgi:transposase-like protein